MFCLFTPFELNRSLFEPIVVFLFTLKIVYFTEIGKNTLKTKTLNIFILSSVDLIRGSNVTSKCEGNPFKCSERSLNLKSFPKTNRKL